MDDEWMEAESSGKRWLDKADAEQVKGDTKMESKEEDRNGLGIRRQCKEPVWVLQRRMKELRRDCKMSEKGPKTEAREGGREVQAPQDAAVTTTQGALRPWAFVAAAACIHELPMQGSWGCRNLGLLKQW